MASNLSYHCAWSSTWIHNYIMTVLISYGSKIYAREGRIVNETGFQEKITMPWCSNYNPQNYWISVPAWFRTGLSNKYNVKNPSIHGNKLAKKIFTCTWILSVHAPFDGGGEMGVPKPLRLFVNHVLTLCSVMPSVSPSGPRASAPLFIATSASLHIRDSSSRWSLVGNWFYMCKGAIVIMAWED